MANRAVSQARITPRTISRSVYFNGANNTTISFSTNTNSALTLTGSCSFSFWMKYNRATTYCRILEKGSGYAILGPAGGNLTVIFNSSGKTTTTLSYQDMEWVHITITYNGSNLYFYKNANLAQTIAQPTAPSNDPTDLHIGNRASVDRTFFGKLAEVTIYKNKVLTQAEIDDIYYRGNYTTSGLSAFYRLNEGSGTTAIDSSGNGNNGTLAAVTYSTDVPISTRSASGSRILTRDFGYSVATNGTTSLIPVTCTSGLPCSEATNYSLSFWHRCDAFDGGRIWAQAKTSSGFGPNIQLIANNQYIAVYFRNDANTAILSKNCSYPLLKLGKWQHIVFTSTPTGKNLYIDSVLANAAGNWNHGDGGACTWNTFTLGAEVKSTTVTYHKGAYDEAVVFNNKILSQAEVNNIYYRGIYPTDAKALYLTFPENTGGTSADQSGNGNNATLTNCSWIDDPIIGTRSAV